jgi:hypothetical protein
MAFVSEAPARGSEGIGLELTISATGEAPARVLRAIRNAYAVGKSPPGRRGEAIDEITTRAQRVGGIQMTVLDLHSGVGATAVTDSILVGRSGNRTYVVTLFSEGRNDPSVQFILSALRFTSA